ncbi:cadherin EGF LAG seven-pass G-type receptor 2 [Biomphalaria glabrata]
MAYFVVQAVLLCLLFQTVRLSPTIWTYDKIAYIKEGTNVNTDLSVINCSDPDTNPTSTYLKTIVPTTPCSGCFNIYKCGTQECLQYRAGKGTLDRSQAASYLVTLSCTDTIETAATDVVEIVVLPNAPPEFVPSALNISKTIPSSLTAGGLIYQVSAKDIDNDALTYKLKVTPASAASHYVIDQKTGAITSKIDMMAECLNFLTFEVTISDGQHDVGPMVIDVEITSPNTAPVAANLDTLIQFNEVDATKTTLYTMLLTDDKSTVKYNVTSSNADGLLQYSLSACTACTAKAITNLLPLDYENTPLRVTDTTIQLTDGYCSSPPYNARLQIMDVNEKPNVTLTSNIIQICEGKQEFLPPYIISEQDTYDTRRWSFEPTNMDPFSIDPNTGSIRTLIDYDVDKPAAMTSPKTLNIIMVDKGDLTATTSVTVSFLDCNDNAPLFKSSFYTGSATACSAPGSKLLSITATDKDLTSATGNNVIYYEGSGGSVTVNAAGDVILNEPMPAGTVVTFNAYAYDRGQVPGPLRSVNPAVISINFTPCPPTPSPAPAVTAVTAAATTVATTAAVSSTSKKSDSNLAWIILAALLGTLFLGLLGFLLWRYGARCLDACGKVNCDKQCCRPRPNRLLTPEIERRPPLQKQPEQPAEKEADPVGPGFLFGFWKERYPDDDFKHLPDRKRLPTPGDMEAHYPHTLDPVEDPLSSPSPAAAAGAPKKNCIVM